MHQQERVDPVTIEVIRNFTQSAARQMRNVLVRASCNPAIYEIIDFSLGLYNDRADLLAEGPGLPHFLATLRFAIKNVIEYVGTANIQDRDVILSTYPYMTGAHSQDAVIIRPIFVEGKIFGYAACKAHWMDIGAKDIYATDTTDIWQEGLQVYGAKVWVAGVPNWDVMEIVRANSRLPDSTLGDLNAQIAACELGARRMTELVAKYGITTVNAAFEEILDHGERITREVIREAPDGEWSACGFLDDNGITDEPVPVKVTVRIKGEHLTVDTSGSAMQQPGPINSPFPATVSFARLALKRLLTPKMDANEGCFRFLEVVAPPGSLFNAKPPAPVFQYHTGPVLMGELLMKALAPVLPDRAVAREGGNENAILFSGIDPKRGGYVAGADVEGVGLGASCNEDGESALIAYYGGDCHNLPIEVLESKFPVQTLQYGLRPDSGGPGKLRGGLGVVKKWKALADLRCITVVEQTKSQPWGLFGGKSGLATVSVFNPGTAQETRRGKQSDVHLREGGEWHLFTGGGGGWGDPYERHPRTVLEDVVQGYVSGESAEKDYGVMIRKTGNRFVLDETGTFELRARRREHQESTSMSVAMEPAQMK
jgi:N-methylhydantoinase B